MFRSLHRASALLIGLFLALHIANHLVGLASQQDHMAFMRAVRPLYRNGVTEPALLILFAWQMLSGLRLLVARWKARDGAIAWAQMLSGAYLAFFLLVHVSAVLVGRKLLSLDTDFRFAAAGFHVAGGAWFFAPYYAIAVLALLTHIGCAMSWALFPTSAAMRLRFVIAMGALGLISGVLIVLSLSGHLHAVDIPADYLTTYE